MPQRKGDPKKLKLKTDLTPAAVKAAGGKVMEMPNSDGIGPTIDPRWCKIISSYSYHWPKDTKGIWVTFRKTIELKGFECPPGEQIKNVKVYIPRGTTVFWCAHRFQTGHCTRLLHYEPLKVMEHFIIADTTGDNDPKRSRRSPEDGNITGDSGFGPRGGRDGM